MIKKLLNLENLTQTEAYELFAEFDQYTQEKQASILALLRAKNETTEEILGALQYFGQYSTNIMHDFEVVDIVGTGGDGVGTFNISTAASIVIASGGVFVAKHGGRSATSKSGSQDVIEALGIQIPKTAEEVLQYLREINYAYLWAPLFNEAIKKYGSLRQKLGFPTIFNILGPLLSPMHTKRGVIGVYRRDLMQKVAEVLITQGVNHALVVHSDDGLDEISISSNTHVIEIKGISTKEYDLNPDDFGVSKAPLSDVRGGNALENATIICDILSGAINGPKLDIVLLNAAAGLYVSGKSTSIADGILLAKDALKQGKATRLLNKIKGSI
ncbi:anthranilate phosphoribosyltransferase [Rickettsiales endosymbiont of Peranema trichophorum]|uniref:anthranilate phosphoribosyltransferase n=1 Tax=Rickettsiales endosymbiont of Peranema trichophorum TaxID=2486577 RepID=UPI001023BF1A|nr:anthranilate phosphoribosyltransferase [Rickettsiales endosymbiont of Peranema trichophorum]RZI47642.1 anthranilate phosphoribosyltransferase [Rickettsiales endosymbiont of Peranema trichophorum]